MNRRSFLSNHSTLFVNMTDGYKNRTRPVELKEAEENRIVFLSRNKKLLIETAFADADQCVSVYNDITWEDPITNKKMNKKTVEHYILDADTM